MAKKFVLVPEDMLREKYPPLKTTENLDESDEKTTVMTITPDTESKKHDQFSDLVKLFPKNYRNKVKLFLHYVQKRVKLDENDNVVYPDLTRGSNIIDHVRYFIMPFSKGRPIDAPQFEQIIDEIGVPKSILAKRRAIGAISGWKTY